MPKARLSDCRGERYEMVASTSCDDMRVVADAGGWRGVWMVADGWPQVEPPIVAFEAKCLRNTHKCTRRKKTCIMLIIS